jgi:hypothetical protein
MDLVNFPNPGSPMIDYMDWDWVCEIGMAGGDNPIQLDGSTPLTRPDGGTKFFNVYGIYEQNLEISSVVRGSGVEWYFVPLNCEAWECNDVNESEHFALKLCQTPCYSRTGMSVQITNMLKGGYDVHYISTYPAREADLTLEAQGHDDLLEFFFKNKHKDEQIMEEALDSHKMQQEAAELDAAPPVGEPALLKLMAPVYFHCVDHENGEPVVVTRWVKAVYFGFETCIADTDEVYNYGDLFTDSDYAMDKAWEAWWDICFQGLIPFIRNLELNQEEAKALFEGRDFLHGDIYITRDGVKFDLFELCYEWMPELDNEEYKEPFMECVTASAEELLDYMCNIVADGNSLEEHTDRELYNAVDFDGCECFNAFISVNADVDDLRNRLYAIGAGADLHMGNVAYWNGDIVCIDFGSHSSTN